VLLNDTGGVVIMNEITERADPYTMSTILYGRLEKMTLQPRERKMMEDSIILNASMAFEKLRPDTLPKYLWLVDRWLEYKTGVKK